MASRKRRLPDDSVVIALLKDRMELGVSVRKFSELQRARHEPQLEHQLSALCHALLQDWPAALPVSTSGSHAGAYLPLVPVMQHLLDAYERHKLLPESDRLLAKFSADGRVISRQSTVGMFFQLLSVAHPQSVAHVVTHAVLKAPEKHPAVEVLYTTCGLAELLAELPSTTWRVGQRSITIDYIYSGDWALHCAQLGVEEAFSRTTAKSGAPHLCWLCRASKTDWDSHADPWFLWPRTRSVSDFDFSAHRLAAAVPLENRRYCWGHAVARLLSNAISDLRSMLVDGERLQRFDAVLRQAHPRYNPSTCDFDLKHSKLLLTEPLFSPALSKLAACFSSGAQPPLWPSSPSRTQLRMSSNVAVQAFLNSLRVFLDFAYTPWPTKKDFLALWAARTCIIGFNLANGFHTRPSVHFLFSHGIELAAIDRTAALTVQEAIEHKNSVDRLTLKHTSAAHRATSIWQQLLDREELCRALDLTVVALGKIGDQQRPQAVIMPPELQDCQLSWPPSLTLPSN